MTETKQYIATEGYPNNYKQNQDCEFNFVAPTGRKIIVQFEDFNLEEEYDYLYFRKLHIMNTHMDIHTDTQTKRYTQTHLLTHKQTHKINSDWLCFVFISFMSLMETSEHCNF